MMVLHGFAAGRGIAIGRAHLVVRAGIDEVPQYTLPENEIANEVTRFEDAIAQTRSQLEQLRYALPENAPSELGVFISLHLMLLNDVALSREPMNKIVQQHINAEWVLKMQTDEFLRQFDEMDDDYLRARRQDIVQVVERIQKNLIGQNPELNLESECLEETILIAQDLSPADTVFFKDQQLAGFVTDIGASASHTAILGRSLNIPSVIGLGNARQLISEQEWVIVDGMKGILIIHPDEIVLAHYRQKQKAYRSHIRALNKLKKTIATTLDGEAIELLANIETLDDIKIVHNIGADGVGLLRTEFQYFNRDTLPNEEELYQTYSKMVKKLKGKPLTIRTVDLGVDKNPRWFSGNASPNGATNPALGLTGIRLCLAEPMMFRAQIRAILRAAVLGKIKMMFPMVSSLTELKQCLIHLDIAKRQLAERQETFERVEIGCMIETPSAALTVSSLLKYVDFISIGTNDLIQYTLSVDRSDDSVSHLYQPAHPAVLKLLAHIIRTANRQNKSVSICGEMAGDSNYTRLLLGMGLRTFSMNTNNLLSVKEMVLHSDFKKLEHEIRKILRNEDPDKSELLLNKLNQITV